jgi:hypothetical protein
VIMTGLVNGRLVELWLLELQLYWSLYNGL